VQGMTMALAGPAGTASRLPAAAPGIVRSTTTRT
jgi:hypothetical protein